MHLYIFLKITMVNPVCTKYLQGFYTVDLETMVNSVKSHLVQQKWQLLENSHGNSTAM